MFKISVIKNLQQEVGGYLLLEEQGVVPLVVQEQQLAQGRV